MLELLKQHHPELILGKLRINECKGNTMEGEVPSGKPGILPCVGHRQHTHRVQMSPVGISNRATTARWRIGWVIAVEPGSNVKDIALLRPEQAGQGCALHVSLVGRGMRRGELFIKLIGLFATLCHECINGRRQLLFPARKSIVRRLIGEEKSHRDRPTGRNTKGIIQAGLGASEIWIDGSFFASAQQPVKAIFCIARHTRPTRMKHDWGVGLVIGEKHFCTGIFRRADEPASAQPIRAWNPSVRKITVIGNHTQRAGRARGRGDRRTGQRRLAPRPGIAKPHCGNNVERRRIAAAIGGSDPDSNLLRRKLCVLNKNVEVAIAFKNAGVEQFVFRTASLPPLVFLDQCSVGK